MLRKVVKELYDAGLTAPAHILAKLKSIDKDFELIFNKLKNKWEVWKARGNDELIWQITSPTEGSDLSLGLIDHLRKYDITNGGFLSVTELQSNWLKYCKQIFYEDKINKQKRFDNVSQSWKELVEDFASQKTTVSVPRTVKFKKNLSTEQIKERGIKVGFNTRTNKPIYAMKE